MKNNVLEEHSYTKIFLLVCLVGIHMIFMISSIIFMITYSFNTNYKNNFLDFMIICIVVSFIIFKKCILIDIYEYIKNLDDIEDDLPDIAKDNYFRNKLKTLFGGKINKDAIDYTVYRLDKLKNVEPMYQNLDKNLIQNMYNHKVHYLLANIILILMLLHKYKLEKMIPLFIVWILNVFKL